MPEFKNSHGRKNKNTRSAGRNSAPARSGQTRPPANRKSTGRNNDKNKKKNKQNNIIYYCMFTFIFVVIVSVLSVTVLFNVREIAVEGGSFYSAEEILLAAQIPDGVNLIRYNPEVSVKNILDKLVYIDQAEVRKDYPSKLTVTVTDAVKMANILLPDGKCLLVSEKGKIIDRIEYNTVQPVIVGYESERTEIGEFISSEDERKTSLIYTLITAAEKAEFNKVTEIDITDNMKIVYVYDGRIRVNVGAATDLREKLLAAKAIIAEEDISGSVTGTLNQSDASKGYFLADIAAEGYDAFSNPQTTEETGETQNPADTEEPAETQE